jgi:4,5:9,10-diseco-3-hydroxy-5,9,17-trioxoandrosta-1(10),2-diene-4-oate hydrolase
MTELTEAGTSRTAKAGDTTLHYNEAGQGEALILLHGGGPGASGWSNFRTNIGPMSKHYRCLLVDMPGFGKSGKPYYNEPQGAYNARALRDLLDTLKIQKAHFIGNSLGGHTALKFALDYPDRAGRLIAMAPASANMVTTTTPMPTEGIKLLQGYYRGTGPSPERLKAFIQTLVYDSSWVTDEILKERYARSIDPEIQKWATEMGPKPGRIEPLWRDFDKIAHPTLLIWGRDDRVVPLDGALFMIHRMKNARLHVFPQCGHWAMIEKPAEFNSLCLDFLGQK